MGFAAEIKEFLGAAKDSWKLMSDTDLKAAQAKYQNTLAAKTQADIDNPLNDEEQKAKIANLKARTGQVGAGNSLRSLQEQYYRNMINAQNNPVETGPSTTAAPPVTRPAIPASPRATTDEDYKSGYNKGGLVRKFAVGGMIEDDDLEDDDELPSGVTPPAVGGAPRATDFSSRGYTNQPGMLTPPTQAPAARTAAPAVGGTPMPKPRPPNPVDDALKYGVTQLPPPQAAIGMGGARSRALRGYAQGAGAAPAEDMVKIYRKIDPKGEMGESERNMYAMQSVWQYKMNQGDAQGAAQSAFQMLQHYKTAATRYAALAKAAMDGGNVDDGIKLALKAYAQVPDGNDMKLYMGKDGHINYEMKDKDGNQISGGIATPAEIGAAAMKLATPGGFENHLVQMTSGAKLDAKGKVSTSGAAGKAKAADDDEDAGPAKPREYAATQEQIGTHVDNWVAKEQKNDPNKKFEPAEIAAVKNAMYHIRRNNDLTDDEALTAARTYMTAPEAEKGGKAPFKVKKDQDAGEATIRYPDGRELTMPMNDYLPMAAARGQRLAEMDKAKKKAEEDAKKETYTQIGSRISDAADRTFLPPKGKEAVQAIGEAAAGVANRVGGPAVDAVRKLGSDVKEGLALTHPGLARVLTNPNDDEDRRVDAPL